MAVARVVFLPEAVAGAGVMVLPSSLMTAPPAALDRPAADLGAETENALNVYRPEMITV